MFIPENTPTRSRTIQGDAYEAAGYPDFSFDIPRPFVAEDFTEVASKYQVAPVGLANGLNQLLSENLGNNMAAKVKSAVKANEALKEGDEPTALPDQSDMDKMLADYDFSGVRASSGGTVGLSPLERALYVYARQLVRKILKKNGYPSLGLAPGATVGKKDEPAKAGELPWEVYEQEVEELATGEGKWGEDENYKAVREEYVVEPAKDRVAADEKASSDVALKLGLAV